ncbi:Mannose-1-phosphate guanylyltransferase [Paenibacillus nuruki]|uniref:mannose-1-phosphate guanylyltransferase n=1 Tax=Paenibacillus nuruki TaxID=1886670 RepID=A0A1E3L5H2_9BACL|nr:MULTISPECIES: sugar phosphate nucleotidyltransferase [Paenibacillus]ODP29077.1 Mannose-1-phosphate guanylyltransferase [Paenibacillus nuruki]TKJ92268.1 mannose-1-phosphate guanylyltransferase [Paenibacillus sp. CFBP13512]
MNRFATILAGGGGTRFWPLSRQDLPKQLLNISGNDIMLNDTIQRFDGVIPMENTIIVTHRSQATLLESIMHTSVQASNILVEPVSKNTAASILLAALYIEKNHGESLMIVFPSDHHITQEEKFRTKLEEACQIAIETDKIVTIGIKPTFAATGYGYISCKSEPLMNTPCPVYEVAEFVEKPTFVKAKSYLETGHYLWNSGMFIWKTSTIIDNFKRFLPRLYKTMLPLIAYLGTDQEEEMINQIYPLLQNISIDYGILERCDEVVVLEGDFGWNDIGSWDALGAIFPPDDEGNIVKANYVGIDTRNSIIYGEKRLITTIGLDHLIIADTEDALLICAKDRAQDIKDMVIMLKEKGLQEYT